MQCCTTGIDGNSDETLSSNATAVIIIHIVIIRKFLRVQGWCSGVRPEPAGFEEKNFFCDCEYQIHARS